MKYCVTLIVIFMRLLLFISISPHHARQPPHRDAVAFPRNIAYKEQYCVPPWVRKYFETWSYFVNASPAIQIQFSAPDSRCWIGEKRTINSEKWSFFIFQDHLNAS